MGSGVTIMRRFQVAVLAIGLAAIMTPETTYADWQSTKWGETLDAFMMQQPGLRKASDKETRDQKVPSIPGRPILTGPYRAGTISATAWYFFLNNELSGVTLTLHNREDAAIAYGLLDQHYGVPVAEKKNPQGVCPSTTSTWSSREENVTAVLRVVNCVDGKFFNSILYTPANHRNLGL
jgi:hypothetical protein